MESYEIVPVCGHYEVYINGKFYCTADDLNEAAREIEDYKKEHQIAS